MKVKTVQLCLVLGVLLSGAGLYAQIDAPDYVGALGLGGPGKDCVVDIAISPENWIWVLGNYSEDITLGKGSANEVTLTTTRDVSLFAALYNEFFEFVEARKIEFSGEAGYGSFDINGNGTVGLVLSHSRSEVVFEGSSLTIPADSGVVCLEKTDGSVTILKGLPQWPTVWSVTVGPQDEAYIGGWAHGTVVGYSGVVFGKGQPNESSWPASAGYYLAKYSSEGYFMWVEIDQNISLGENTVSDFHVDGDGTVLIMRDAYKMISTAPATPNHIHVYSSEGVNQKSFHTVDAYGTAGMVRPMNDGGIVVCYYLTKGNYYYEINIDRYDSDNNLIWRKLITTDRQFEPIKLEKSDDHILFMTQDSLFNYTPDGLLYWKKELPGYKERLLATDNWGYTYVADKFDDEVSFDNAGTLTSAGSHDIYLAKLDKSPEAAGVKMSGVVFFYPSHTPMQDVLVATGDGLASDRTDEYGYYELKLPYGWTGDVSLTSHGFDLSSGDASYVDPVTADIGQQDYWFGMAPEVEVSGRVLYEDGTSPVPGCTVTFGEDGSAATATDGSYTVTLPYGWSGSATVSAYGMPVTPAELSLDPLYHFSEGQNFTVPLSAEKPVDAALMAAGSMTLPSAVTVAADGDVQAVEVDGNGSFTLTLPRHWSGTLTPTLQGYRFFPESLEASAYGDAPIGFAIYDAAAPEAIFCGGDSLALLGFVRSSLYPVVSDTLPEGWDSLPLTLLGSDAQVSGSNADGLQTFVENGGALVLMQDAPTLLTGGADLSAAPWLGAASLVSIENGTAVVTVDEPLGTTFSTGDALGTSAQGWSAAGLSGDAITLSAWDEASGSWHSYVRIEGSGKVAYWGSNNWQNDAELDLFAALLNWARNANTPVAEETITEALPSTLMLHRAYPNPFNPSTSLEYGLPAAGEVRLEIYDVSGRRVKVLESGYQTAGIHQLSWRADDESGRRVASGLYIARLQVGDEVKTQKLMLMK